MTIKEFKEKVNSIPEEYDSYELYGFVEGEPTCPEDYEYATALIKKADCYWYLGKHIAVIGFDFDYREEVNETNN
jgi:hypothetical protein